MTSTQATQNELATIQELNSDFNKAKMAIGDIELQKQQILQHIEELKIKFSTHEQLLIDKYGKDSVINIQTGEVTIK
jgi:predicted  nucleic acid-binding Zn-ribbon protein